MKKFLLSLVALFTLVSFASADELVKQLTFPAAGGENVSSYTSSWTATVNGEDWIIDGFNSNKNGWTFIKCGRKGNEQTATISSPVFSDTVNKVVIKVQKTSDVKSAILSIITSTGEVTDNNITEKFTAGDVEVTLEKAVTGAVIKLTINSASASANGPTWIDGIELYGTPDPNKFPDALGTWTFDDAEKLLEGKGIAILQGTTHVKGTVTPAESLAAAGIVPVEGPTSGNGAIIVPKGSSLLMNAGIDAINIGTYSIMYDVKADDATTYIPLLQNDLNDDKDGSLFINKNQVGLGGGLGYNGNIANGKWYRIVFVVEPNGASLYLNGEKLKSNLDLAEAYNKHWLLTTGALFFADEDGEEKDIETAELRFWNVALTDAQVEKLGAIKQDPVYSTFASANAEASKTSVTAKIKFTDALVTYVSGNNIFLQDATGGLYLYNVSGDITVKAGDKVKGSAVGGLVLFNGLPEVSGVTLSAEVISSDNAVNPVVVSAVEIAADPLKYANQFVQVKGAKFAAAAFDNKNVNINAEGAELVVRNNFGIEATFNTDDYFTVAGILSIYNKTIQLYPTKPEDIAKMEGADTEYFGALAAIKDGAVYRIKATVDEKTYYLKPNGRITESADDAGGFQITQKAGGALYNIGFLVDAGSRFSNPPGTSESNLKCGYISTSTASRADYDAQVFFLNNEGKYAVRATNVGAGATSGWAWVASSYWTVEKPEEATEFVAQYQWDPAYIWELEYVCDAEEYAAKKAAADIVKTWVPTVQAAKGLVTDASQFTANSKANESIGLPGLIDGDYSTYFHTQWGASGVTEPHYLQATLPDAADKFYFYFVKRDPVNNSNVNNRPTDILISGSNDGENFTTITEITQGLPATVPPVDYMSDKITATEAYKIIRFTVLDTNNHATDDNGNKFFTFSEFYILPALAETEAALDMVGTPTYLLDAAKVKEIDAALKAALNTVKVTYALYEADGTTKVSEKVVVQEGGSEVAVPAELTNIGYYSYAVEGTIGNENCEIKITRSFKEGLVQKLENLSNAKAYTIACDRGAFVAKDGNMCSTALNGLGDAAPSNIAIISYEDNYYFYSVADQKFVTNTGALADMPTHGAEDAVVITAKTVPYFFCQFNAEGKVLNTNGNAPLGYVINSWNTPDAGNQYYMIEAADFDATAALAALEAFFNPSYLVTYEVKDEAGKVLFTSEEVPATLGAEISALPADYQLPFTKYTLNGDPVTIKDEKTTITFTATWDGPFQVSPSFEEAKWYNMTIRGDYYVAMDAEEPYYPTTDKDLFEEESQWAFAGDAYSGIYVYNKAAGDGWTLTKDGDNVVMREGIYSWTIGKNSDGFTLKETGTDYNCVNQNGGSTGPLQFWNSANSPADNGSTFRVTEVQIPAIVLNAPSFVVGKEAVAEGTQTEFNWLEEGTKLQIKTGATNILVNNYTAKELAVKITVMVSGDLPENIMNMGSTTAHRVMGETFEVDLGTKDFPVELKPGYIYQNIAVMAAELVVKETGATVATYDGAPVQLHWVGVAAPTYAITVADGIQNGTVEADKATAAEGETVALTIKPAENYELDKLIVTAGDAIITVAEDNTFVMPAEAVTIKATFKVATLIKDIKALEGAEIYDLGGSKTQKIQKGKAYIIDGKTYIAK